MLYLINLNKDNTSRHAQEEKENMRSYTHRWKPPENEEILRVKELVFLWDEPTIDFPIKSCQS